MLRRKSKAGDPAGKAKGKAPAAPKRDKQKPAAALAVKAKSDIYTVLLGLSLLAILLACLFLALEMSRYQFDIKGQKAAVPAGVPPLAWISGDPSWRV